MTTCEGLTIYWTASLRLILSCNKKQKPKGRSCFLCCGLLSCRLRHVPCCLRHVSCVPSASFSGFFIIDWTFGFLCRYCFLCCGLCFVVFVMCFVVFVMFLVYPPLVSLDCSFLIGPSVFSDVYIYSQTCFKGHLYIENHCL